MIEFLHDSLHNCCQGVVMRYFVMSLLLLACGAANAQPLPDPFVVVEADSQARFTQARVTMRDSVTADIFYAESRGTVSAPDNHLKHAVVSLATEQVIAGPEELPATTDRDLTFGDVASRGVDGWVALTYEATHWYHGATGHNRTLLTWGSDAMMDSAVLDTGYMPFVSPQSGDHTNSSFSLCPRAGGGWLASWINEGAWSNGQWSEPSCTARVVTFDADLTEIADQFFAGGQVSPWGPEWVRTVSWSADSVLALLSWSNDLFLNWVPRTGEVPLAYPTGCSFSPLDLRRTHSRRLLAWGGLLRPGLFLFELNLSGQCSLLDSTAFTDYVTSSCWHADYGFALLDNHPHVIMLARVDTLGHAVQPPGSFYESDPGSLIAHSAAAITPNGRVVVLWGERQVSNTACTTLKMAWVDWATYLGVDDRNFIPHPSSFILSCFPNPFNARTEIRFSLPQAGKVSLDVFDITGRKITSLLDQSLSSGEHTVPFDGSAWPSGIYFLRLATPNRQAATKLILLK
jgi:hypothetical protein